MKSKKTVQDPLNQHFEWAGPENQDLVHQVMIHQWLFGYGSLLSHPGFLWAFLMGIFKSILHFLWTGDESFSSLITETFDD